jgi:hypothetical protein
LNTGLSRSHWTVTFRRAGNPFARQKHRLGRKKACLVRVRRRPLVDGRGAERRQAGSVARSTRGWSPAFRQRRTSITLQVSMTQKQRSRSSVLNAARARLAGQRTGLKRRKLRIANVEVAKHIIAGETSRCIPSIRMIAVPYSSARACGRVRPPPPPPPDLASRFLGMDEKSFQSSQKELVRETKLSRTHPSIHPAQGTGQART